MLRRGLVSIGLLVMSGLLLSGCRWKKTETVQNSVVSDYKAPTGTLQELTEENLLPTGVQGSRHMTLAGQGITVQDDGLREVFVNTEEKTDVSKDILSRVTTPTDSYDKGQLSIKQATISVGGHYLTIPGLSGLVDDMVGYNAVVSASGNDLVIKGTFAQPGGESYVLIKNTLTENYLITNPQDWFGASVYMIPQQAYSLLKMQRGSDLQSITLWYVTGSTEQSLAYGYEDRYAGQFTAGEELLVPAKTALKLTSQLPSAAATVHHVVFTTNPSDQQGIERLGTERVRNHLTTYAQTKGWGFRISDALQSTVSGAWLVTTTEDKEQGILVVEPTYSYLLPIHNYPFTVELQKDASDEYRPYYSRLLTSYLLDGESVEQELKRFFGEKRSTYQSRDKAFTYEIEPKRAYTGTLTIRSLFGQTATVKADYFIEKIDPRAVTQEIVSNQTISILPRDGTFQDILVQYKNIETFEVFFQACDLIDTPDVLSAYKGVGLENYLFDCKGAPVAQKVVPTEGSFSYRKAYRTPVNIPDALVESDAFKVFFKNQQGQEQTHYMLKSDLGLRTKVADNQLMVRGFTFADGKPLTDGTIKVTNLEGKNLGTATLRDGMATINIPYIEEAYDYATQWKKETLFVELTSGKQRTFVMAHKSGWGDLSVPAPGPQGNERYLKLNSKLDVQEVAASNQQINQWGMIDPVKLYGYTDRGLYKAGETISFAGWVRNVLRFDDLDYLKDEVVSVTISNPMGGEPVTLTGLTLDKFGGFAGSYTLPNTLPLGEYLIEYRMNDRVAYTHNIKVEEYQKPTFFVDITHAVRDGTVQLVMKPSYFFGAPLTQYDLKVTWSLVGKDVCWYCWWWNEDPFYFNHVFNDTITTGGTFTLYNQTSEQLFQSLYPNAAMQNKGYQYTLKVDAIVKDRLSDETQYITKHIDFQPEVMIGLSGQPYEWLYREGKQTDPRTTWKLEGKIDKGASSVKKTRYEVYRWSYDQTFQQGVDGNLYVVNGQSYLSVGSGEVTVGSLFTIPHTWLQKPGEYFVRVIAEDAQGATIGEVHKKIGWYQSTDEGSDLLGAVPNTYTLTVDIPKKTYQEGEEIPVNIVPYQRDAWVVVTVERGQYIIDSFLKKLDGNQLTIPVKKGYAPNIIVSVMMLQGTSLNTSPRKEPRFFAGYAEAQIDTKMHELTIGISADKPTYQPGDTVTLTFTTTDAAGKPVDARVSVAVVDQALTTLYTLLKEPLPYFFNKVGTSVFTYTNMKLLYQSLKAFATGGTKGGSGQGGKAMFSYIRDDLPDAAFWSGAVYTVGGKATVTFTAPDNLTTWLVDAIGISTDTKLGTASTGFVVKKDLIIEPNAPLFVTLGDQLTIPVKVVVPGSHAGGKVTGSAWLVNEQGERKDLGTFTVDPNKTVAVPLAIPYERWTSQWIELGIEGSFNGTKDGMIQRIPLRSDGFMSKDTVGTINKAGTHTFVIPESLTQQASVRLSQLPTNFIDPIATYLVRYPYGCTEQLLSSLLPLLMIEELTDKKIFQSPLLSGGVVQTPQGPVVVRDALRDGVAKLLLHQRPDGGFGYRAGDKESVVTEHIYVLSAWVYEALHTLRNREEVAAMLGGTISRLESFLVTNKGVSKTGWYHYLLVKVMHGGSLSADELAGLDSIVPNDTTYLPLLRYVIAVAQKDSAAMTKRKPLAHIPTNTDTWTPLSVFWNTTTATALKLRALIQDPAATQQERSELLLSLLKQRNKDGLRGWSTQTNLQVARTLSALATYRQPKKEVACTVKINNESFDLRVSTQMQGVDFPFVGTGAQIDWSCDSPLLADIAVSFLPKDLEQTLGTAQHVTDMTRSLSEPTATIGQQVDIVGSFSTDLAGEQVAVELFVPSDYKLLEVISTKNQPTPSEYGYGSDLPFVLSDAHCYPTHRETRFDRLFLYYETLEPGTCDITIPAIKAYSGTTTVMPMRVAEMYKGLVNGRKVIIY